MADLILGIDPGSRVTGYGLISVTKGSMICIHEGCIRTETTDLASRLKQIYEGIYDICVRFQPQQSAVEEVFFHRNANSALKLGQSRGAAVAALAVANVPVAEYSTRQIKQAIVGYGAASKEQIQHMVKILLNLVKSPVTDAADALAAAICHSHMRDSLQYKGLGQEKKIRRYRRGRLQGVSVV